ncbi:hypothetical protein ACQUY5_23725 [Bacillus cereus]|uniref:hypothetical protein n=1 Tax=Bacillus cereus TaxID=1396 RepID=UPI003D175902
MSIVYKLEQLVDLVELEMVKLSKESGVPYEEIKANTMERLEAYVGLETSESKLYKFVSRNNKGVVVNRSYDYYDSEFKVFEQVVKEFETVEVDKVSVYVKTETGKSYSDYKKFTRVDLGDSHE